jgi:hypothetical protein
MRIWHYLVEALLGLALLVLPAAGEEGWPTYAGNPGRTGTIARGPQPPLRLLWEKDLTGEDLEREIYKNSPLATGLANPEGEFYVQGDLLVMATRGGLLGLDAATGEERWRAKLETPGDTRPVVGGFSIGPEGNIYALANTAVGKNTSNDPIYDADLVIFDGKTGKELARLASESGKPYGGLGNVGRQSPCLVGGMVYIYAERKIPEKSYDPPAAPWRKEMTLPVLLALEAYRSDSNKLWISWQTPLGIIDYFSDRQGSVAANPGDFSPLAPSGCVMAGGLIFKSNSAAPLGSTRGVGQAITCGKLLVTQNMQEGLKAETLPSGDPLWVTEEWQEYLSTMTMSRTAFSDLYNADPPKALMNSRFIIEGDKGRETDSGKFLWRSPDKIVALAGDLGYCGNLNSIDLKDGKLQWAGPEFLAADSLVAVTETRIYTYSSHYPTMRAADGRLIHDSLVKKPILRCWVSEAPPPPASVAPEAPSAEGKIIALYPAPDNSCVALLLEKRREENLLSLMLFDPDKRRIIAETPAYRDLGGNKRKLYWSNDSHRVAASAENGKLVLLNKNGELRTLQEGDDEILDLRWRGDKPNCLVLMGNPSNPLSSGSTYLKEIDARTGAERKLPLPCPPESLYIVQGKPWIGYLDKKKAAVGVAQVDPWRREFEVPLTNSGGDFYNCAAWDFGRLEVSPDKKYFHLILYYSAGIRDIIARVPDAGKVCREPWRAILWQDGISSSIEVDWLRQANGKPKYDSEAEDTAVINCNNHQTVTTPQLLQLITGNRSDLAIYPNEAWKEVRQMTLWRTYSPFGERNSYLVLTERGLEILSDTLDTPPPTLLLRQAVVPAIPRPGDEGKGN